MTRLFYSTLGLAAFVGFFGFPIVRRIRAMKLIRRIEDMMSPGNVPEPFELKAKECHRAGWARGWTVGPESGDHYPAGGEREIR